MTTQKSQRSGRSQIPATQTDKEEELTPEFVNQAVRAILTLDHTKRALKHADILGSLPVKLKRKCHPQLWDQVRTKLKELGMELVESSDSHNKCFFLVADKADESFMHEFFSKKERADRTLLILVLAFIFMKDGVVTEDELFRHLTNLHVLTESGLHDYFGDVKKKIQGQFVEHVYLTRCSLPDQDNVEIRWGERAKLEVPLLPVLQFVCKVAFDSQVKPQQWASQYGIIENNSNRCE